MGKTDTQVDFDLNLNVNFTIQINSDVVDQIKQAIKDGEMDMEVESVEEYITNLMIDEIDNSFDSSVWLPEVDGEMRAWICSADTIKNQNATRLG